MILFAICVIGWRCGGKIEFLKAELDQMVLAVTRFVKGRGPSDASGSSGKDLDRRCFVW
jgi:hypothetical protein